MTSAYPMGRGRIAIEPDAHPRQHDARATFPGYALVHATANGERVEYLAVELIERAEDRWIFRGGYVDKGGDVDVFGLHPGEYELVVRSHDYAWFYWSPQRVTVRTTQTTRIAVDAKLVRGKVMLCDPSDGKKLAKQYVDIRLDGETHGLHANGKSDDDGLLELTLPPGRYSLRRTSSGFETAECAFLMWPTGSSVPVYLSLPRTKRSSD